MNVVAYSRLKNKFFGLLCEEGLANCTAEARRTQRKSSKNCNSNKPSVNSVSLW
jgi:hypothetical protein